MSTKLNSTDSTRELGLDLTLIAARHLFHTDHLHFGYWPEGLPVEFNNLQCAQEKYTDLLVSHIPPHARTILDVGSGTGALARRLLDAGYHVDCVSPSASQTTRLRALLEETVKEGRDADYEIFECRYEDLKTEKRYDVILFSESFQYIALNQSLRITTEHLAPEGYVLICDYFRKETPDKGPFGGGHKLKAFQETLASFPLHNLVDQDITERITPNLDMVADFVEKVIIPVKNRLFAYLERRYSIPFRILRWIFRKHLERADEKYLTGKRRGENFKVYKTYRLLLFQFCPPTKEIVD